MEEEDDFANDAASVNLAPDEWYSTTCSTYEVRLSKNFKEETKRHTCMNIGGSVSGGYSGWEGGKAEASVNASYESCSDWVDPPETYIWFMEVAPQ